MSEIPIEAEVHCTDGRGGKTIAVIINPYQKDVTHIVVKDTGGVERIVPWEQVIETTADKVELHISLEELQEMDEFLEVRFEKDPRYLDYTGWESSIYAAPYVMPVDDYALPVAIECVPPGDLAFHRGSFVEATDGHIGKVKEFIIRPDDGHITHLILQKGHLWGKRWITIPLSAVDRFVDDTVYLKLDKHAVSQLPSVPVKRHKE